MDNNKKEREIVLDLLMKADKTGTHSHVLVRRTLDRCEDLSDTQRSFIKRLFEGTLERRIELDEIIDTHRNDTSKTIADVTRNILRMSLYQIYYMDAVPDFAACNEAVLLLKKRGLDHQTGFVNGMLRRVIREKNSDQSMAVIEKRTVSEGKELSVKYSMPELLVKLWTTHLGEEETEKLLASFLMIRPVQIRVDERLSEAEREELIERLQSSGAEVSKGNYLPYSFALRKSGQLTLLPGFKEGEWTVQDESSMLAAEALGLSGNETVYDVCAAPGGKSTHIAAKLTGGCVIASDLTPQKAAQIRQNADRMHLTNLRIRVRDARTISDEEKETADAVLCDVPCSGLGVIGKKRDIKYHISREKLTSLNYLQKDIVKSAAQLVRPGGVFLYSTCTINRAENEEMARFIVRELGLLPDAIATHLPAELADSITAWDEKHMRRIVKSRNGNMLQLLPHMHGTDGFFLARFVRPLS